MVLDTNVLLRALASRTSGSRQIVSACEARRLIILLSKPIVDEYRVVLGRLKALDESITDLQIESLLRKLRYLGEYYRQISARFELPRDPTDAKIIELAIEGNATHLVTYDQDLLTLPGSRSGAGKRFRQRLRNLWVGRSEDFLRQV